MKTNQRDGRKSKAGRIVMFVMIGLALIGAVLLPVYQSQLAAQALPPANSLPTRLSANPDGSATVSFNGAPGATYQIYYSDNRAASPETMQWTLVADDLMAGTNTWTEWIDAGDVNRSRPGTVQQRYYRVVLKPTPPATVTPQPLLPISSTFAGFKDSLGLSKLQEISEASQLKEIAEIGRLIAGGAQTEAQLIQKLAHTTLTVAHLLELGNLEEEVGNWRAAQLIYEAILGPKASQATTEQLALAHLGLGNVFGKDNLHPTEAIAHYLTAAQLQSNTWTEWQCLTAVGQLYRLQGRYDDARSYWGQVKERAVACHLVEDVQWLTGLSYYEEQNFSQALVEFGKLAGGYFDGSWQADGQYWVGESLRELGQWEEARDAYAKITELKSQLPQDSPFLQKFNLVEGWTIERLAQIAPHLQPQPGE